MVYLGAGRSVYRVDVDAHEVERIHHEEDGVISFVTSRDSWLVFAARTAPRYGDARVGVIDLEAGKVLWRTAFDTPWSNDQILASPMTHDGTLILANESTLSGWNLANGETRWTTSDQGWRQSFTPTVSNDGLLYYATDEGVVEAAVVDGSKRRTFAVEGRAAGVPVLVDDTLVFREFMQYDRSNPAEPVYVGISRLVALDLKSGKRLWSYEGQAVPTQSPPVVHEDGIVDAFGNRLLCIDLGSGRPRWVSDPAEAALSGPRVVPELGWIVLLIPSHERIAFYDISSGERCGPRNIEGAISEPLVAGTHVVFGRVGSLAFADARSGRIDWAAPLDSSYLEHDEGW